MCMIIFVKSEDEYSEYVSSKNFVDYQIYYELILQFGSIDACSRNQMTICCILLILKSTVSVKDILIPKCLTHSPYLILIKIWYIQYHIYL